MSSIQAVTASAKDWLDALARLAPVMAGRKPVPILYLAHVDPSAGMLSAFNYEVSAVTRIAESEGVGAPFLIPYQWLLAAIRTTSGRSKTASVTVSTDGLRKVSLSARGYELHAETDDVSKYPDFPLFQTEVSRTVAAGDLRAALRRVSTAASTDESLPILNTVRVELISAGLDFLATDRYRLAQDCVDGEGEGEGSFQLKLKIAKALDRFLVGEPVVIGLADKWVSIVTDNVTFRVMTMDGDYPNLRPLFPTEVTAQVEIDRAVLLQSANVAKAMSERNLPCYIRMFDGGAEVTFADGIFGPSRAPIAFGEVVAGAKDEVNFAMNPGLFVDALSQISTDKVRISYTTQVKPFVFSPEGMEATAPRIVKHLIMPVRMPR